MMLSLRFLAVLASTLTAVYASLQIVPGGTWTAVRKSEYPKLRSSN
jgi:hypothetical protein